MNLLRNPFEKPFIRRAVPGDCGCGTTPGSALAAPVPPPTACATICDPRYFQLAEAFRGRGLIVPVGGNCQVFLAPPQVGGVARDGLVWIAAQGDIFGNRTPALTLPFVNPLADGAYPSSQTFTALMVTPSSADEHAWQFFHAPSTGEYLLYADNGVFRMKDAGTIPGLSTVCTSQTGANKVNLLGCAKIDEDGGGEPIWGLRKLTPQHRKIIVGDVPGDDVSGWIVLPADEYLEHPLIKATEGFRACTYQQLESDGSLETGGMNVQDPENEDTDDAVLARYSPDAKKFLRAPTPGYKINAVTADQAFTATAAWAVLPGTHGTSGSVAFNYGKVMVFGTVNFEANKNVNFKLTRDGTEVAIIQFGSGRNITFFYIDGLDTPVEPGNHTYRIEMKRDDAEVANVTGTIRYSSLAVVELMQ